MPDIVVSDLRGGRNGIDSPIELPENQCVEALNVDWRDGPLGEKRAGAVPVSTTGGTAFSTIMSLIRHVPTGEDADAELWGVDAAGLIKRMAGGTAFANVTMDDALTGRAQDVTGVTFNKKLFLAYKSAVDRLHVYDPVLNLIRRVGLDKASSAPTVVNQGAGSYAAIERLYRVRFLQMDGDVVVRRSEPSDPVTITPSGGGASIRVTRPAGPNEHETHWELEVSLGNELYFVLYGVGDTVIGDPIAIGTTTQDDNTEVEDYLDLTISEDIGMFSLPASARYLATDGNRLLMAGNFEDGTKLSSRVQFTPVLGSSDHGDDERVFDTDDIKGWVDLNEKDGGKITGLSDAIQGSVYAFKYRQTHKLVPTGDGNAPYLARKISNTIGCIAAKSVLTFEDAEGNPVVGFLSYKGPYRISVGGFDYVGRDVEDIWFGVNDFNGLGINLEATTVVAHGVYYSDASEVWWYLATGTQNSPGIKIGFDVRQAVMNDKSYGVRGGWFYHTGKSCKAVCSVMFANTLGAAMSHDLKPYISYLEP